jgi:hypothetical protein
MEHAHIFPFNILLVVESEGQLRQSVEEGPEQEAQEK